MACAALLAACASPENPSFPLTEHEANEALRSMRERPVPLRRPVVVLGGYSDPGFAVDTMRNTLEPAVGDDQFVGVSFNGCEDFDACRDRVLDAVLASYPDTTDAGNGRRETIEVDVVTNSMGGLVGRYAAMWPTNGAGDRADVRLRVVRMHTIVAPHQGAGMADPRSGDALNRGMAPGSPFLAELDAALPAGGYELVCYGRVGDMLVGLERTAPPGQHAYWLPGLLFEPAHMVAFGDERFLADIARRLRGETPFTIPPPAPYPDDTTN